LRRLEKLLPSNDFIHVMTPAEFEEFMARRASEEADPLEPDSCRRPRALAIGVTLPAAGPIVILDI